MRPDLMNLMRLPLSRALVQGPKFRYEGSEISLEDCVLEAGPILAGTDQADREF